MCQKVAMFTDEPTQSGAFGAEHQRGEERAAGRSEEDALEIAAATSGRSVLVSGITVMVAMGGMLFAGDDFAAFGVDFDHYDSTHSTGNRALTGFTESLKRDLASDWE